MYTWIKAVGGSSIISSVGEMRRGNSRVGRRVSESRCAGQPASREAAAAAAALVPHGGVRQSRVGFSAVKVSPSPTGPTLTLHTTQGRSSRVR